MNDLRRLFAYVKPWWKLLLGGLFCTFLFALFSGISIGMILPFTKILFEQEIPPAGITVADPAGISEEALFPQIEVWKETGRAWFMGLFADADPKAALLRVCIGVFVIFLIKGLFNYYRQIFMATLEERVIKDIRDHLYHHMERLPLSYFEKERTGVIISRITNDVQLVREMVGNLFSAFTQNASLLLIFLVVALIINWQMAMLSFLVFPLIALFTAKISKRLRRHSARFQEDMGRITSTLQETIAGIRIVKAFGMERFEEAKFAKQTESYLQSFIRFKRTSILASPISEQLGALGAIIVLWYGGNQVLDGNRLAPEEFFLFLAAVLNMMQPIRKLSHVNTVVQQGLAAARRIFFVLDTPIEPRSAGGARIEGVHDAIAFENVSFSYDNAAPALSDITLRIEAGTMVALVGPSGAGKSTLADLVARFHSPTSGRITIDGLDLQEIEIESLRENMGIVTQEVILFNDSVRDNIAYGKSEIPEETLRHAARAASADEFITNLPDGYETIVGDRGVRLSGGERQRLAIARAILKDPPILILDEATSNLDTQSEALVQAAVENLVKDRTTLAIAHRLSTILRAHRILVLDHGRIVEEGTHEDLVGRGGLYSRLFEMQFAESDRARTSPPAR